MLAHFDVWKPKYRAYTNKVVKADISDTREIVDQCLCIAPEEISHVKTNG